MSDLSSKQDCTCRTVCNRRGNPFPDEWSWRCKLLPFEQPHPLARAAPEPCALPGELAQDIERKLFAAIREADAAFEKAGATGTKSWVRDFLLSRLEAHGLGIGMKDHVRASQPPSDARALLERAEELFQDECDPLLEPDSYAWLQDVRECLRPSPTKSAPSLKCPKCLADRTKEPCPEITALDCPISGVAHETSEADRKAAADRAWRYPNVKND